MFRHLRVHQIFGANTEVGKTLFATALCRASVAAGEASYYLKPIGTGKQGDDSHIATHSKNTHVSCLYRFDDPVSPHLAAQRTQRRDASYVAPDDATFTKSLNKYLDDTGRATASLNQRASLIVETAGGVHSPTLSGTTQAEAYRSLRLPTILVASPHLGGISTTLASYESLLIRGYTVDALVCLEEEYYENHRYFEKWSRERDVSFATMRRPPEVLDSFREDAEQLDSYYSREVDGTGQHKSKMTSLIIDLQHTHEQRLKDLEEAPAQARSIYWYPFVQHSHITRDEDIMVIDSAHKDDFIIHRPSEIQNLQPIFDGSASWWTQAFGHSNSELILAAAQAAGRYGHVIFPSATHAPALALSKSLLKTVGKGWADRVFFSDDGSTGMEVALKMALKRSARQLVGEKHSGPVELSVLGMRGSYHGDTIGVMDASEPSVYNKSVEWYKGRGFWLDVPTVQIENAKVTLRVPTDSWETSPPEFTCSNLPSVYDVEARLQDGDKLYDYYYSNLDTLISRARKYHGLTFGALVIEPLVIGAGGMLFVDPLFQRALVDYARQAFSPPLPVVYDEVFVGLYRLGIQTASQCLGVQPDVACYAKILTGGMLPMAVTLASQNIFEAFLGEKKQDALLHGHSYTAQPIGCAVSNKSLELLLKNESTNIDWQQAKASWNTNTLAQHDYPFFSLWSLNFINEVSALPNVDHAMTMGTVLKITLKDEKNAGYQSTAAVELLKQLREPANDNLAIHARPLGNTLYWMTSVNTPSDRVRSVEAIILEALRGGLNS